ncbi:hypothetical protein KIJ04_09040 [Leuconostoc gelidum subsp. gelidum]|uniref:hypothetical protein n=1 Tax=Leuconostoc gelidum TaxID=1244 RepID=UPI001CC69E53|nr:hypothetical protein [Leuconostoc gelidum]MBZ6014878.1 hypothetical protein [Leuconostoc gelidum subsp. gelidum]
MSKQKLSTQEKNNKLNVQLELLRQYAKMFDSGITDMALPMATQVRVLVHQTKNSNSLLNQLDLENKFKFWHSPNSSFSPNNLIPSWDLLMMSVGPEGSSYLPLGSKGLFNNRRDSSDNVISEVFLPVELWWQQIVFSQKAEYISRRDIVLFIANKDGGSHVDGHKWPMDDFKESQLLGFYDQNGNYPNGNPLYSAMRQIAEELLVSFEVFQTHNTLITPGFKQKIQFLILSENENNSHLYFNFLRDISDKSKDQNIFQIKEFTFKYYDNSNWSFFEKSKLIKDIPIIEVK